MANATIREVGKAVRKYRRQKSRWLPKSMWEAITRLRRQHDITEIAEATGFSEKYLRRRLGAPGGEGLSAQFCEIKPKLIESAGVLSPATVVEVKRPDGAAMTVRVRSEAELKTLFGTFVGR